MKIAIGCDHGGVVLKSAILEYLKDKSIEVIDYGTNGSESVDYPDFARAVAESVAQLKADKGILMCGTGIGISIAANKVKGIRCAVVHNEFTAQAASAHNNANILSLGGRILSPEEAVRLIDIWLNTAFEGGRHVGRLDKISEIENQ